MHVVEADRIRRRCWPPGWRSIARRVRPAMLRDWIDPRRILVLRRHQRIDTPRGLEDRLGRR